MKNKLYHNFLLFQAFGRTEYIVLLYCYFFILHLSRVFAMFISSLFYKLLNMIFSIYQLISSFIPTWLIYGKIKNLMFNTVYDICSDSLSTVYM